MRIFPINNNKVVFACFEGDGGYGCNPKYIAEELIRREKDVKIIWLTHNPEQEFPPQIKAVKDTSLNTAYHLSTGKVWIDNYRKPYGTLKRKGQLYIQTWHASIGFKAVGLYRGDKFPKIARLVSEWDSNLIDYIISNSDYCDRIYPKKLLFNGPTLRVGSPRVDILINKTYEDSLKERNKLGVNEDDFVVLYAPTFRGGNQKNKKSVFAEDMTIDFEQLSEAIKQRFNRNCVILLRLHPQLAAKILEINPDSTETIDVSKLPDISEIMVACDMLITDYSSCAFDAAYANIPVILYADDIQEYISGRGELMWTKEEIPFDVAENNDELKELIVAFDETKYIENVEKFLQRERVVEDGNASRRVVDMVMDYMN